MSFLYIEKRNIKNIFISFSYMFKNYEVCKLYELCKLYVLLSYMNYVCRLHELCELYKLYESLKIA